jgi:dTMP kinase
MSKSIFRTTLIWYANIHVYGVNILSLSSKEKSLTQGFLIAIEGNDGAGKTTQVNLLVDRLKNEGYPVISLHEPTDGVWGQKIRDLIKNDRETVAVKEELNFIIQDRLEDVENNIKPALEAKQIVVMDSYYFSNIAYYGARGLNIEKMEELNKEIAPQPDLLLILDVNSSISMQRISQERREESNEKEKIELLEKTREKFNTFTNREYVRVVEDNGQCSPQEIANNIWGIAEPFILRLNNGFDSEVDQLFKEFYLLFNRNNDDEKALAIETQLISLLCPKGKTECVPTYCVYRETDTCDFLIKRRNYTRL